MVYHQNFVSEVRMMDAAEDGNYCLVCYLHGVVGQGEAHREIVLAVVVM